MLPPAAAPGLRIGLFGGSFNPPHEGHRLVALQCLRRLRLDRIWVLVSPGNPLKDPGELAPLAERVAATRAVMRHPRIEVTDFEAARGFRYSWQTVAFLTRSRPATRFVWLMGGDSLVSFDRWARWQDIAQALPMAVYARPGAGSGATRGRAALALARYRLPEERAATLPDATPPAWVYLTGVTSAQSSSALRRAVALHNRRPDPIIGA